MSRWIPRPPTPRFSILGPPSWRGYLAFSLPPSPSRNSRTPGPSAQHNVQAVTLPQQSSLWWKVSVTIPTNSS